MGMTSFSCKGLLLISSLFHSSDTALERSMAVPGNGSVPALVRTALSIVKSLPGSSNVIFADHDNYELQVLMKALSGSAVFQGSALFNPETADDSNRTSVEELVRLARQVRLGHREVKVILLSDDLTFVSSFGRFSLERRLLGGHSRLLVVGRLSQQEVNVLSRHWTFSMMNTFFVLPSIKRKSQRWNLFTYLPFTASGSRLVRVGFWTQSENLVLPDSNLLFPQKFSNMYGRAVNVSALPYEPYWVEEKTADGGVEYSGTDRLMLEAMAASLNFSISLLPVKSWEEVIKGYQSYSELNNTSAGRTALLVLGHSWAKD
ncbi:uncharacterized protein LOC135226958 [Macrobrachium nipponense]|uniref:uncharacterized protein LOC135226958 n=1 Tax=Macrobrachium nipponense TaxID=159736 RepID=UPI0030C7B542